MITTATVYVYSSEYPFERKTPLSSGFDLYATWGTTIEPGSRALLDTGVWLALPPGVEAEVRPRSGRALSEGLTVLNSPGTIDADYRNQLSVLLINLGPEPVQINAGERIAQLVLGPVYLPTENAGGDQLGPAIPQHLVIQRVDSIKQLSASERGLKGWGSTGR